MNRHACAAALLLTLVAGGRGSGGGPQGPGPGPTCFLGRVAPAGGWFPYGGGLLRWWDPHCFPRCGGPDDYCRKKRPGVCWPPYPSWYIWGPPETCSPQCGCGRASGGPR
jgi:hypothetical protein